MDYKAQGPEKCTASILFDSTFGRPLYSSGMQFSTDHIAVMETGERSTEADSVRDPLTCGGGGCCIPLQSGLSIPRSPTPPRPQGVWLVRGGLRQSLLWQLFAFFVICLSFHLLYSHPITGPQPLCILALTGLRTLRGSFRSYSV